MNLRIITYNFTKKTELHIPTERRKKVDSNVVTGVSYGGCFHFPSWSVSTCNQETDTDYENQRALKIITSFEGEHLERAQTS